MKTSREIRQAIVNTLKLIKTANGYKTNFPNDKIYGYFDPNIADRADDVSFPRCFVMLERGNTDLRPAGGSTKRLSFVIIVQVKKINPADDPQKMIEDILDDLETLFYKQNSLGNVVTTTDISEFIVDGGELHPEGALSMRITTECYRNN